MAFPSPIPQSAASRDAAADPWAVIADLERQVRELTDAGERLTTSLVATNDELLGMYAMTRFFGEVVDAEHFETKLAMKVLEVADGAAVVIRCRSVEVAAVGDAVAVETIRAALDRQQGGLVSAAESHTRSDMFLRPGLRSACAIGFAALPDRRMFTPDIKLIQALFAQVDGYIGLAELHEAARDHALVAAESRAAAEIASMALPEGRFERAGLDVAARSVPAHIGAGDFYTWCTVPHGAIFAVGDVAGKGLPAAVVMTHLTETLRHIAAREVEAEVDELLSALARGSFDYLKRTGLFATVMIARWDERSHEMTIANAGHSPICIRRVGGDIEWIPASCPPVGVFAEITPEPVRMKLEVGDALVVGSDGLVEQEDQQGRQLGADGFAAIVTEAHGLDAAATVDHLFAAVEAWDPEQTDDRTGLVVRRVSSSGGEQLKNAPCRRRSELRLEPDLGELYLIGRWVAATLQEGPAPEADATLAGSIELAVHELAVNAIIHGETTGPMEVHAHRDDSTWTVDLIVEQPPFDPDVVRPPGELQEHGYGISIVRQLATTFESFRVGATNVTRLVFAAASTTTNDQEDHQ